MSAQTTEIVDTLAKLEALLSDYLGGEARDRLNAGISVNRNAGLYLCRATVIAGLPSIKLDGFADAKRARRMS